MEDKPRDKPSHSLKITDTPSRGSEQVPAVHIDTFEIAATRSGTRLICIAFGELGEFGGNPQHPELSSKYWRARLMLTPQGVVGLIKGLVAALHEQEKNHNPDKRSVSELFSSLEMEDGPEEPSH